MHRKPPDLERKDRVWRLIHEGDANDHDAHVNEENPCGQGGGDGGLVVHRHRAWHGAVGHEEYLLE